MRRAEAIKFKLMPDGHIRGVQTQRSDLASAAEWMIYIPLMICPTISAAHPTKLLIENERLLNALRAAAQKEWD